MVGAFFGLTENLLPLAFIIKENLRTYGLVLVEKPLEALITIVSIAKAFSTVDKLLLGRPKPRAS